jgi:hypothetical protein
VLVAILQSGHAYQTHLSFSGYLERVGTKSVSVQLPDRVVIDALLPADLEAATLAAQYHMGDEVEMSCLQIQPVWEEDTARFQSLEAVSLHLLRHRSPEEVSSMLEAIPREGKNMLERPKTTPSAANESPDPSAPGYKEWEHARKVNLEYASAMPNFVADESAKRYRSGTASGTLRPFDTIDSEVTFRNRRVIRQQIRRNGRPWDQPFDALPGFKWYEGFETEISPLFETRCPTEVAYQGSSRIRGRQALEYRFSSPVDGCFSFFYFAYRRYNPARTGRVFIDEPSGSVVRVDDDAVGFPPNFEFAERHEQVFWDYVKIGGSSHLLPVGANFLVRYSSGTRYRIEVEYRNHRHFEASSNLTFQ